ncbi:MAG: hypothetical protein KDJ18_04660 [Hyphomicrobiaceae bacterium]|nr:hypothetical protein [Hyphomicrobiaceae bacterium]
MSRRKRTGRVAPDEMPASAREQQDLAALFELRARSIRNRTRGRLGEVMAATIVARPERDRVVYDRVCFKTPLGLRRIDCFDPLAKLAIESKNTYVCATRLVRAQIEKDAFLLREGRCNRIIWALYKGGSARVLRLLAEHPIEVRMGWDGIVGPGGAGPVEEPGAAGDSSQP